MNQNQSLQSHLIVFATAALLCFFSIAAYATRSNNFADVTPPESFQPVVTNSYILQSQLPADVYAYTIGRVDDYLRATNQPASSLSVRGGLTTNPETYDFTIILTPQEQRLNVTVRVVNFSSIISTAVLINGQLQSPLAPGQGKSGQSSNINGLDSLTNAGVTALQARSLEAAFQKYAPAANTVTIDPSSITHPPTNSSNATITINYAFNTTIDNTTFHAVLRCPSLNSAQLILTNQAGKQVFDSGTLTSE